MSVRGGCDLERLTEYVDTSSRDGKFILLEKIGVQREVQDKIGQSNVGLSLFSFIFW